MKSDALKTEETRYQILENLQWYKGCPININIPEVSGQLIVSKATDFYIVVNTRMIEEYYELNQIDHDRDDVESQKHYKIGGFVKVHPNSIKRIK